MPLAVPDLIVRAKRRLPPGFQIVAPYMYWSRRTTISFLIKPATGAIESYDTPSACIAHAQQSGATGIRWITGWTHNPWFDLTFGSNLRNQNAENDPGHSRDIDSADTALVALVARDR